MAHAVAFAGQGSQTLGMGRDLFPRFPTLCAQAETILGYSVVELCLQDPQGHLQQTAYTQPALFAVNAMAYLARTNEPPAFLAGHSLGEYNALLAAEVFDFETGLRLVKRRGELMARATGGAMAAVVGLGIDRARNLLEHASLGEVEVANDNSPDQFVISGSKDLVDRAVACLRPNARACIPLKVSGAFHSSHMRQARLAFHRFLLDVELKPPCVPVVANATARAYEPGYMYETLAAQIDCPVRWTDSVRWLVDRGVTSFEEIAPKPVLSSLIQQTQAQYRSPVALVAN